MIPYEIDPSLHPAVPAQHKLLDGFSPPSLATHPVEPEPLPPGPEPGGAPNPSHLPVEPEFGPQMPPAEPEAPITRPATV